MTLKHYWRCIGAQAIFYPSLMQCILGISIAELLCQLWRRWVPFSEDDWWDHFDVAVLIAGVGYAFTFSPWSPEMPFVPGNLDNFCGEDVLREHDVRDETSSHILPGVLWLHRRSSAKNVDSSGLACICSKSWLLNPLVKKIRDVDTKVHLWTRRMESIGLGAGSQVLHKQCCPHCSQDHSCCWICDACPFHLSFFCHHPWPRLNEVIVYQRMNKRCVSMWFRCCKLNTCRDVWIQIAALWDFIRTWPMWYWSFSWNASRLLGSGDIFSVVHP